jgi:WD40 repeat protein/beta-lactamase regulating signal transducer with metallopeptidase domain
MSTVGEAAWLAIGWTMLHFLWVGGLIGIAAGVVLRVLRGATPEVRYGAALASLAMLAAAPAVIGYRETIAVGTGRPVPELRDRAGPALPLPVAGPIEEAPAPIARTEFAVPAGVAIAGPIRTGVPPLSWPSRLDGLASRLPWIWLLGSPITFVWVALGLAGAERLRRRGDAALDGELRRLCRRLAEELGIAREVAVAVCERLTAPVLVGIVRPLILLPASAMGGWGPDQVEMVLLHELAHVRRWDNLVNLLQRLIESALFFHPAVWIISSRVRREREHCCDAIVVGHTGRPRAYAEALLSLADRVPDRAPRAAVAMAGNDLVARVRRILNLEPEDHAMKLPRGLLALTAAILIVPAGFTIGHAHLAGPPGESQDEAKERGKPAVIQGRTVDEWLAALKNPDPAARRRAVEILGERALAPTTPPDEASRLQTAVGALLFTDEDAEVRRAVASFADRARGSDQPRGKGRIAEDQRMVRREQLKKLRDKYADLLKMKREALRKLAESVGSDDRATLALRQQYALEHLHYLQTELQGIRSQKRKLEAQLKAMTPAEQEGSKAPSPSEQEVDKLVERHPAITELTGQLAEHQRQLATKWEEVRRISRNPSDEPSIKALRKSVQDLRESLARRRREVRPEVIRQAAEGSRGEIARSLAILADLEQQLDREIQALSKANQSLTVRTLDLRTLQDEIAQIQAAMERIDKEPAALDAEQGPAPQSRPAADGPAAIQGKTIDEWLAALKDRDPAVRLHAVEVLGERSLDSAVPENERSRLGKAVSDLMSSEKDPDVRQAVAFFADLRSGPFRPTRVKRALEARRRTVRPTTVPIRLVDAQGRPVAGAVASTYFERDADREPSFTPPEAVGSATSDVRGELALKLPAFQDALGLYAIRQGGDHPLVGIHKATRDEVRDGKPLTIAMLPACRVRLRVECPGFRDLAEKYHAELGGPDWWRAAYVGLGEDPQASRPLFTSSTKGELEFLLPPGRFKIMAYGADANNTEPIVEVKPGHRVLSLGVVDVSPNDAVKQGIFRGYWRSIRRDARTDEERIVFRRLRPGTALKGEGRQVQDIAYSPDGRILATAHWYDADPGEVKLWDAATGGLVASLPVPVQEGGVLALAFSPDGKILAGSVGVLPNPKPPGVVVLWDVAGRRDLMTIRGHTARITALAFAPDGRTLASGGEDRTVRFWDVATGREVGRVDGNPGWVRSLAYSPDGKTLAIGSGQFVKLWDVAGHRPGATLEPDGFWVHSVAFAPDGRTLASGGSVVGPGNQIGQGRVRLYDLTRSPPVRRAELTLHREGPGRRNDFVSDIAFTPDGRRVAGIMMTTIAIWDAATGDEQDSLDRGSGSSADRLAVSPDGRWMAVSGMGWSGVSLYDISPPGPPRDATRPPGG